MARPTVFVTGCSGFIGEALARRLSNDYRVVGADIAEPSADASIDDVRHMDLTSDLSVEQTVEYLEEHSAGTLASVVHLAAYYDFSGEESPLYRKITVEGTERLLKALRRLDVEQFVFTSTMLVHAPVEAGRHIDEDSPLDPHWPYPRSKLETEQVVRTHRDGIPAAILRLAGVYTDWGQQPTLAQQIKRIYDRDFTGFFFPGDTEAGQSLVHLDDAVDAIVRTVDRRRALGPETELLIGEPDPPSYRQLQDEIGRLVWGTDWPTIRVPKPVAEAGAWLQEKAPGTDPFIKPFMIELADDHYGLDVSRAHELLGWSPEHRLLEVLPRIVGHLRRDADSWYRKNELEPSESVRQD